jgi:hypothetical protein
MREVPDGPRRHRQGASFAPALQAAASASAFDQLLAFLGRDAGWLGLARI